MNKLCLRFLIHILHLLMQIREGQTHSQYSWNSENELLQDAYKELNKGNQ